MKRYYLCDLIGDGSDDNPFRPAVADLGVSWAGSIVTDDNPNSPTWGRPVYGDCLVIVNTDDHAKLRNVQGIDPMPDFPRDGKASGINVTARNAMNLALQRRGFSTLNLNGVDGYGDMLQAIGRQRDPAFDIDKFDVV